MDDGDLEKMDVKAAIANTIHLNFSDEVIHM
jgi:hypothetical protein